MREASLSAPRAVKHLLYITHDQLREGLYSRQQLSPLKPADLTFILGGQVLPQKARLSLVGRTNLRFGDKAAPCLRLAISKTQATDALTTYEAVTIGFQTSVRYI